jgi:hypothetical protein
MSETPEVTAKLLTDVLLAMDLLVQGKDEYFSLQEFALGLPLENRTIDLCYGFAKVPPTTSALAEFEAVIGHGVSRITNEDVTAKLTKIKRSFTGLDFTTLLPSGQVYQNVYAFANIFLEQSAPSMGNDNPAASVSTSLLKGELSGTPIFMTKDLDVKSVIEMSRKDEIPDATCETNYPSAPPENIKIFNVIIEINYFDPDDLATKDVVFHYIDKRKPRGWGGFAEEFMGVYLTPYIINKNNDYDKIYNELDQSFYNLVKAWINLRFWSPSFIDFWTDPTNSDLMPERLKEYLDLRFSILI